jgi:hypothetical protein
MILPGIIASQVGGIEPSPPPPPPPEGDRIAFAITYSGTGSAQTILGVPFVPELVWLKRTDAAEAWGIFDDVRGVDIRLQFNTTASQATLSGVSAFNSDGFSLGASLNASGGSYTAACLRTQEGAFTRVLYSGNGAARTIAHSLGFVPQLIIIKGRSAATPWTVYFDGLPTPATQILALNTTAGRASSTSAWNSSLPTSTTFPLGVNSNVNGFGVTYIAYLFASKTGVSFIGSYTGDGGSRTPKVTTGFRPRVIIVKRYDTTTSNWIYIDNAIDPTNPHDGGLNTNLDVASFSTLDMSTEPDGFTIGGGVNVSGVPYLVLAL